MTEADTLIMVVEKSLRTKRLTPSESCETKPQLVVVSKFIFNSHILPCCSVFRYFAGDGGE